LLEVVLKPITKTILKDAGIVGNLEIVIQMSYLKLGAAVAAVLEPVAVLGVFQAGLALMLKNFLIMHREHIQVVYILCVFLRLVAVLLTNVVVTEVA
jgi:hypothetical protein